MRIVVYGATGGTGTHVVRQALAAGHHVTAVVRDPARLSVPPSDRLVVVPADVMDPDAAARTLESAEAVVSALGPRPGGATTVCSAGTHSILTAMTKTAVRRLVVVSASGPYIDGGDGPFLRYVAKPVVQRFLREGFADLRRMDDEIVASDRDWTIVRPPRLTDKAATGRYRQAVDVNVGRGLTVARADVAVCILRSLADDATIGHVLYIAN